VLMVRADVLRVLLIALFSVLLVSCKGYKADSRVDFGIEPVSLSEMRQLAGRFYQDGDRILALRFSGVQLQLVIMYESCQDGRTTSYEMNGPSIDNIFYPGERTFGGVRYQPGWYIAEDIKDGGYEYFVFRENRGQLQFVSVDEGSIMSPNVLENSSRGLGHDMARDLDSLLSGRARREHISLETLEELPRSAVVALLRAWDSGRACSG